MVNISFIGTNTIENLIDGKVNLGGTINWTSDTVSGGTDYTINKLQGTPKPLFFKVSQGRTIKTLSDTKVQSVQTVETGTTRWTLISSSLEITFLNLQVIILYS
ncbi:MAG: hypothetical protein CM15mV5_2960 [uncultured marine virus]|nr:MAG: hypothetical protein CM15mV5_2960 [uncultured marine virus]